MKISKKPLYTLIAYISFAASSITAGGEFIFRNNSSEADIILQNVEWNKCNDDDSLVAIKPGKEHKISWDWVPINWNQGSLAGKNCELTRIKFTKILRKYDLEYPFEYSFGAEEAPTDGGRIICEFNNLDVLRCFKEFGNGQRSDIVATWDPSW